MKIELKNTEFKELFEFLEKFRGSHDNIVDKLRPQYEKAFKKYQDETQEFQIGDEVQFKHWRTWRKETISKTHRLANGQYRYIIKFKINPMQTDVYNSNPLTKKNIKRIKHEVLSRK